VQPEGLGKFKKFIHLIGSRRQPKFGIVIPPSSRTFYRHKKNMGKYVRNVDQVSDGFAVQIQRELAIAHDLITCCSLAFYCKNDIAFN
jgi:hypothetical protein